MTHKGMQVYSEILNYTIHHRERANFTFILGMFPQVMKHNWFPCGGFDLVYKYAKNGTVSHFTQHQSSDLLTLLVLMKIVSRMAVNAAPDQVRKQLLSLGLLSNPLPRSSIPQCSCWLWWCFCPVFHFFSFFNKSIFPFCFWHNQEKNKVHSLPKMYKWTTKQMFPTKSLAALIRLLPVHGQLCL